MLTWLMCVECLSEIYKGAKVSGGGGTKATLTDTTAAGCAVLCQTSSSCKAVEWYESSKECWAYTSEVSAFDKSDTADTYVANVC